MQPRPARVSTSDFDVKFNTSSGPSGQVEILFTSGGLLHSSRWTGFSTLEQALAGGNLNIR